jgi:hypothetical protein
MAHSQNEIAGKLLSNPDLADRELEVLNHAANKLDFKPKEIIGRSHWWGSTEYGAFHCLGEFQGQPAVLKIQGVKPETSEIYMLEQFAANNQSSLLRPPLLYASLPWNDELKYEALILENVEARQIVNLPTNPPEIKRFFDAFREYREKCRSNPWITKPQANAGQGIQLAFNRWREISLRLYADHPLRAQGDQELIQQAVDLLITNYSGVELEFVHAHLADKDLLQVGNQIVVISNLYWSGAHPFTMLYLDTIGIDII